MNSSQSRNITNNKLDYFLIYCPLWFPIIYLYLISNFPSYSPLIFILSIFLFAETHFASTWLFFFDKENKTWIKDNLYKLAFLPAYILFMITLIWVFTPNIVLVIHYLASGFHVTRQSIGITKISKVSSKLNNFLIYFFSFLCLIIGLSNPGILSRTFSTSTLNIVFGFISITYIFISQYSNKIIKNFAPVFTGISIYLPLLFFDNLGVATVVGVGMHWCQYIILMFSINLRKFKRNNPKESVKRFLSNRILFIFLYSLLMTSLTFLGMPKLNSSLNSYSVLYLIPILFQLYHFYIDGFIWRFSDNHIKNSVSQHIFGRS